ncbi:hypothetical protein IFM89_010867 [Coptis chinensis]|uniref:Uncharacterized protein n=1 Tax=Coptis chinensis TaxID=261450 RepID=A0A835HXG2_9MAGN|nr:hypothetical protein IFM89_010867 [Coptis chinensis]
MFTSSNNSVFDRQGLENKNSAFKQQGGSWTKIDFSIDDQRPTNNNFANWGLQGVNCALKGSTHEDVYLVAKQVLADAYEKIETAAKVTQEASAEKNVPKDMTDSTDHFQVIDELITVAQGCEKGRPGGARVHNCLEVSQRTMDEVPVEGVGAEKVVNRRSLERVGSNILGSEASWFMEDTSHCNFNQWLKHQSIDHDEFQPSFRSNKEPGFASNSVCLAATTWRLAVPLRFTLI